MCKAEFLEVHHMNIFLPGLKGSLGHLMVTSQECGDSTRLSRAQVST